MSRRLRFAVAALALGLCLYIGRDHLGELERLRDAAWGPALAGMLLFFSARFSSSEAQRLVLANLGYAVKRRETFLLAVLVSYANLALPRAGLGTPALYLKHRYGVAYAEFGALQFPILACMLFCVGAIGSGVHAWVAPTEGSPLDTTIAFAFAAAAVLALASAFVRLPAAVSWDGAVGRGLRRVSDSWAAIWKTRSLVASILAIQLVALGLRALRVWAALLAIGVDASPSGVLYASLLADVMLFFSITPSGIGLREAAIAYGAAAMGTTPELALSAAVLDRIVSTVGVIVVAQFGLWSLAPGRLPHEHSA